MASHLAGRTLIHAGMALDGTGRCHSPAALLIEDGRVAAAGTPQGIGAKSPSDQFLAKPSHVLVPALVNAHTHLDLSHMGPVPYTGDFLSWVDLVRDRRQMSPESIAEAVHLGARLAHAGGTALVGDIAGVGSVAAAEALRSSKLCGVSYLELFGQGSPEKRAAARATVRLILETVAPFENGVRIGLQPHAPYSCAKAIYEAAVMLHAELKAKNKDLPLATHLAETPEELEFVHQPHGSALAGLLAARSAWDDSITGFGCHPIEALAEIFSCAPFVAAHLNYIEDRHVELLSQWPITVAYCPRASAYFGHPRATSKHRNVKTSKSETRFDVSKHRYRDMVSAGVNVALGTDSILCLDTPDRISILDEMRFLYRRDGTDPIELLCMATINGAKALGFAEGLVTFDEGPIAGVLAMPFDPADAGDPFVQVLTRDEAPEWVIGP